jgi:hypothetical protein
MTRTPQKLSHSIVGTSDFAYGCAAVQDLPVDEQWMNADTYNVRLLFDD